MQCVHSLYEILLILVGHFDVLATGLELVLDLLAVDVRLAGEREVEALDVVRVHDELHRLVVLDVDGFDVLQRDGLVEHHLVEGSDEEAVDETVVVRGHADDAANEVIVVEMVLVDQARVWIYLQCVVVT